MRIIKATTLLAASLAALSGCTVKDIDQPALAGPSTFAHSLVLTATNDTLTQNGVDFTDISVTSLSPNGTSENIDLRAQVFVDGIPMDFGTLNNKNPRTPTTVRYTAPGASSLSVQVPQTVTIMFTPTSSGDFRSEFSRQIDIRLLPQGIILPSNPNLVADFTVTPNPPEAFQIATFDASLTMNNGTACQSLCTYSWDFGDRTTGTGRTTTHQYRTFGNMAVTLLVTDSRGAQAVKTQILAVTAPTPPDVRFTTTPASPVAGQDVFFSAAQTTSPTGRAFVSYEWNFGDGFTGTGVTTSHRYSAQGSYTVVLKVTDDVGAFGTFTQPITVLAGGPTVAFTFLPATPRVGTPVTVNVTATPVGATTIASYTINWGDGSPNDTGTSPTQTHVYGAPGNVVITVTATDNLGHSRTVTQAVVIAP
jgi:chitodextrinase